MHEMKVTIGTRSSKLALWQARCAEERLRSAGFDTTVVTIDTTGDKILDKSIAKIGSKGVFTAEIEEQLAGGSIDIAVHSAKDMPSALPEGFELIAFMEREKANDVVVSRDPDLDLKRGRSYRLGTSSVRRVAMLRHFYPHVEAAPVRGNLQTRIQKMDEGRYDALILAYAGICRMGYEGMIVQTLDLNEFTPAVGQGAIAIEVHQDLANEKKKGIRKALNHEETETCLLAERAFLKKMDGGCSVPVFGLANLNRDQLHIFGGIISLDGQKIVKKSLSMGRNSPMKLGEKLAGEVLYEGGNEILKSIKERI